eukprot:scaffold33587_cov52-Attheya_sp.AAC.4
MRDNPNPSVNPDELQFAGDNFVRISGDAVGLADTQLFAWDAADKGVDHLHPQANPSQAEMLKKKFKTKSADLKVQAKERVLNKYGGSEYLDGSGGLASAVHGKTGGTAETEQARKARFGVSITSEEYTRDGRLLKDGKAEKQKLVPLESKYEEDTFINGHKTNWGSYFHKGAFRWGYADDHSLMKNSYCTGMNGRIANDDANDMRFGTGQAGSAALAQAREMLKVIPQSQRSANSASAERPTSSKLYGESDQFASYDKDKLKEAIQKTEAENKTTDQKRKYNSMNATNDVTPEEMEAYRLKKGRGDDPMARLAETEQILDYAK